MGEAISGNVRERPQLASRNGYPELGIFVFALHLKADARKWLMEHGHPHLMAVIQASRMMTRRWNGWRRTTCWCCARSQCGGDEEAFQWLVKNEHRELAMLGPALKMWSIKMQIKEKFEPATNTAQVFPGSEGVS